jgi:hypothetical protein
VADEDVVVRVNDRRANKAKLPKGSSKLCDLFLGMRSGIPGVRHQLINRYLFKSFCVHLHVPPASKQLLHHAVLRTAFKWLGAVLLYNVVNLIPEQVGLLLEIKREL